MRAICNFDRGLFPAYVLSLVTPSNDFWEESKKVSACKQKPSLVKISEIGRLG